MHVRCSGWWRDALCLGRVVNTWMLSILTWMQTLCWYSMDCIDFYFITLKSSLATYKILSKSNWMLVNSILFLFSVLESNPGSVNAGQGLGHWASAPSFADIVNICLCLLPGDFSLSTGSCTADLIFVLSPSSRPQLHKSRVCFVLFCFLFSSFVTYCGWSMWNSVYCRC